MLLSLLACGQPTWHLLDPGHEATPADIGDSEPAGDSERSVWDDPIALGERMDVENHGIELTDIVRIDDQRIVLIGQQQQQNGGAWLVDVSDPDAPVQLDQLHEWVIQYACWDGEWLWGAARDGNLFQVEVGQSTLAVETLHQGMPLGGTVTCDGQYVAWGNAQLGATISQLIEGELRERVDFEGTWYAVELVDGVLWTAGAEALASWDPDGGARGTLELPGTCRAMRTQDRLMALGCGSQGVILVDVSDPDQPVTVGQWKGHASVRHVAWQGHHVLASAWTDLLLLDASDPSRPEIQATEPRQSAVMATLPDGEDRIFVADWRHPFVVTWQDVEAPELRLNPPASLPGSVVLVHNDGRVPLLLDPPAEGELDTLRVEPGAFAQWTLPESSTADTLELSSNDPDEVGVLELGAASGVPLGEQAPDFVEEDTEGQIWTLSEQRGKVVWLGLFDEGCPVCATEVNETENHMARWAGEEDLVRLWAFRGSEGQALSWIEEQDIRVPVLLDYDGSIRHDYFIPNQDGVVFAANPRHYVIDRDGVLVYASTNVSPTDEDQVIQAALDSESDGR